jgi:PilZ domain
MKQKLMASAEDSMTVQLVVVLVGRHGKTGVERAVTENVSARGLRIFTASEWFIDDTILIALPSYQFTSAARVVYCEAVDENRFETGLEFIGVSELLDLSMMMAMPKPLDERSHQADCLESSHR